MPLPKIPAVESNGWDTDTVSPPAVHGAPSWLPSKLEGWELDQITRRLEASPRAGH